MHLYDFPEIKTLDDVLPAIQGSKEFIVADRGTHTVVNYVVVAEDTFPPVKTAGGDAKMRALKSYHKAVRRECRGLIFDKQGKIISRRFHKFFNMNEREETRQENLDLSIEHVLLEKLDGSMVSPFMLDGKIHWSTKMGTTDVAGLAQAYVDANPKYVNFSRDLLEQGYTPIFEWCSNKNKIVLDYPEDQLVLTAIRENVYGYYSRYENLVDGAHQFDIMCVQKVKKSIEEIAAMENTEGVVLRYDDADYYAGHMVKIKTDWYALRHKSRDAILREKNVLEFVINDTVDDVLPYLTAADAARLMAYKAAVMQGILDFSFRMQIEFDRRSKEAAGDRKAFALSLLKDNPFHKGILFKMFDGHDAFEQVRAFVKSHISTNEKIGNCRHIINYANWEDFK